MAGTAKEYLLSLCDLIHRAEQRASQEREREELGDAALMKRLVMRVNKVRVEIRKENVSHNEPHLHLTHEGNIDVSLSLNDFRVLAGNIDGKSKKHLLKVLVPAKPKLLEIWNALNEQDDHLVVEKLISELS